MMPPCARCIWAKGSGFKHKPTLVYIGTSAKGGSVILSVAKYLNNDKEILHFVQSLS